VEVADQKEEASTPRATGQVKVTADGRHAVAALEDGRLGVLNMRTGGLDLVLPRGRPAFGDPGIGQPLRLALTAGSARVMAQNEKLMCVWDLDSASVKTLLAASQLRHAALTPDGKGVVYIDGSSVWHWMVMRTARVSWVPTMGTLPVSWRSRRTDDPRCRREDIGRFSPGA
jgi:hypothetical protein